MNLSLQIGLLQCCINYDLCKLVPDRKLMLQEHNFETADERFSAQKLLIKEHDQEDRHVDRRKRRERKLQKKLKRKQAAAEEQGVAVVLGGGESDGMLSAGSDEELTATPQDVHKARKATGAYKGMVDDDSDQPNSPVHAVKDMMISDQEQLALRLLGGGM